MSLESQDRRTIEDEVASALLEATEVGQFLTFTRVRHLDDGTLVADLHSATGHIESTYTLEIIVGAPLDES